MPTEANRQVTFRAPGVEIEVMVIENGSRRLVGQLVPPAIHTVELVGADAVHSVESDELGRFTFDALEPGPVRLVVLADGRDPHRADRVGPVLNLVHSGPDPG